MNTSKFLLAGFTSISSVLEMIFVESLISTGAVAITGFWTLANVIALYACSRVFKEEN